MNGKDATPTKQTRYVSANQKKKFASSQAFFREMAGRLVGCCSCDGRGCVICISADALEEAANLIDKGAAYGD